MNELVDAMTITPASINQKIVPAISVSHAEMTYAKRSGQSFTAVNDVSMTVLPGEFVCLVGKSGCGKTTLLNLVAGLIDPTAGTVAIFGQSPREFRTKIGYMFARDALYPWRTAVRNAALGLEFLGVGRKERTRRAQEHLELVGLGAHSGSYPRQLSQGMRQRVAIARTLATEPELLLMDEPFASVDAQTRGNLQEAFLKIWESRRRTVLLVTHDLHEAMVLGDRVIVVQDGRIDYEVTMPFERPRDLHVLRKSPEFHAIHEELYDRIQR